MRAALFIALLVVVSASQALNRVGCFGANLKLSDSLSYYGGEPGYVNAQYLRGKSIKLIGQGSFTFQGGSSSNLPTQASTEALCDDAASSGEDVVVIDIESWPVITQADRLATKAKFQQTLAWCKARLNANQWLTVYAFNPIQDYGRAIRNPNSCCDDSRPCTNSCTPSEAYAEWQTENDEVNFSDSMDALAPSLYLFYYGSNPSARYTDMITYLTNNVSEAKRISGGVKPVMPFIWSTYHPSADVSGAITDISTANPAVVTSNETHSIQTGMTVYLAGMTGSDEVEFKPLTVTRVDDTHFSLDGINGSSITAYTSGGHYQAIIIDNQWEGLLDTLASVTDKAILWGNPSPDYGCNSACTWQDSASWWLVTKQFVNCQ